jgi:RecA/RadA recombinase
MPTDETVSATGLHAVAKNINARLQEPMVRVGAKHVSTPKALTTGFRPLDRITGFYGLPRGRITELVGRATSGRTTVAIQAAARVEGFAAWIDVPGRVDIDQLARQGVDLERLFVMRPPNPQDALAIMVQLAAGAHFDLVVLDSLADIADGGPTARTTQQFLRVLTPRLGGSSTAAVILTIPEQHDQALAYAAALRIAFSLTGLIRLGGILRGWRTRATTLKAPGHQNEEVGLEVWL